MEQDRRRKASFHQINGARRRKVGSIFGRAEQHPARKSAVRVQCRKTGPRCTRWRRSCWVKAHGWIVGGDRCGALTGFEGPGHQGKMRPSRMSLYNNAFRLDVEHRGVLPHPVARRRDIRELSRPGGFAEEPIISGQAGKAVLRQCRSASADEILRPHPPAPAMQEQYRTLLGVFARSEQVDR